MMKFKVGDFITAFDDGYNTTRIYKVTGTYYNTLSPFIRGDCLLASDDMHRNVPLCMNKFRLASKQEIAEVMSLILTR